MKKPIVVVDASFWINCVYLNLESYLFNYFILRFTTKVKAEIIFLKHHDFFKKSRDIFLFEEYVSLNKDSIKDPSKLYYINLLSKDSGELYSISLAKEENGGILIDDGPPYNVCDQKNIPRMNSIDFIIFLYIKKEFDINRAINLINSLKFRFKEKYIFNAIEYIKKIK